MVESLYPWKIEVRDSNRERRAEVDDYQLLDMELNFNDVSKWTLTIDRRSPKAQALLAPGSGIVVTRNGNTVLSGAWQKQSHQRDDDQNTVTLSGSDDTLLLTQRLAHPEPATLAPPYNSFAEYVVGPAQCTSTMCVFVVWNLGPAAPIVGRRVVAGYTDAGYGSSVTGRGRWQTLMALFQELAAAGAVNGIQPGFRVVNLPAGLWFETYRPVDRTATVKFGFGLDTMKGFTYDRTAPESTYYYVGGPGEGTARTIYEQANGVGLAAWDRSEVFVDAASAANDTELAAAATKEDTDKKEQNSFAVTPIDTPRQTFGVHYNLGDRVSAVLDVVGPDGGDQSGDVISDILRKCKIRIAPDSTEITPVVGTDGMAAAPVRMFQKMNSLAARVADLERR